MRSLRTILVFLTLGVFSATFAYGATITGTVKGPDGAPFQGAFVQAQNTKTKITVSVLSNKLGAYQIPNLPAGEYQLQVRSAGYRTDPKNSVNLTADQNTSVDWALQKGIVRWTDLST